MKQAVFVFLMLIRVAYAKPPAHVFEKDIQPAVFAVTLVMMHDVVDPPAASRYYSYCTLGADAIVSKADSSIIYPSAYIKSFPKISIKEDAETYNYKIASILSIYEAGAALLPSGFMLQKNEDAYIIQLKKARIASSVIEKSLLVAKEVNAQIIAWSQTDNYRKLSTLIAYTPKKGDGYWYPTPPGYFEAVQPHWTTIRTMVIDSSKQFIPQRPVVFSKEKGSKFYDLAMEVDTALTGKDSIERMMIASFWDCNPFNLSNAGHMSIGFKKMTPDGHWMNIASIVSAKAKINFDRSVEVQTLTAVTMMDVIICCWDEKYRSNRIRPETYINRYISEKWVPYLQTPPFPEYTSGHSVISTAAATVLTYLLGDNFSYTDNSEVMFEIEPRSFHSFNEAAAEAAISRLYGGIHFRDGIVNGQVTGKQLGDYVVKKIKAAGIQPFK